MNSLHLYNWKFDNGRLYAKCDICGAEVDEHGNPLQQPNIGLKCSGEWEF